MPRLSAFSLVEMTVVLLVLAVISSMGIGMYREQDYSLKRKKTDEKLTRIEKALENYRNSHQRLPCPANGSVNENAVDYGREGQYPGNCRDSTPAANFEDGETVAGVLPVRTLQLPNDMMYDAWGRRFTYAVDRRMTHLQSSLKYGVKDCDSGSITVYDAAGSPRTERAVYALISHGENGHGAFLTSGARRNFKSTNTDEHLNAHHNATAPIPFTGRFMQKREQETAGSVFDNFDDMVRYKERWAIANVVDIWYMKSGAGASSNAFVSLSAGYAHTCVVTAGGTGYCWGSNTDGQLGDGTKTNSPTPVQVQTPVGQSGFEMISAGNAHSCGLTKEHKVYCWGKGMDGQIGDGTGVERITPVQPDFTVPVPDFVSVATGAQHSCAITGDGDAYCWGWNGYGQLGDGSTDVRIRPVLVDATGVDFTEITASRTHTCGLDDDGNAYCWGANSRGQLGDGTLTDRRRPVAVTKADGIAEFQSISANGILHDDSNATCAITNKGAYCWGSNAYAQLGNTTHTNSSQPTAVSLTGAESGYKAIGMGGNGYACAIGGSGAVYCWGDNAGYGQIGNDSMLGTSNITAAMMPTGVTAFATIEAGEEHVCAISAAQTLYCWGAGHMGQIGDGGTQHRGKPSKSGEAPACS